MEKRKLSEKGPSPIKKSKLVEVPIVAKTSVSEKVIQ